MKVKCGFLLKITLVFPCRLVIVLWTNLSWNNGCQGCFAEGAHEMCSTTYRITQKKECRLMKPWCLTGFLLAVLFIFGCQGPGQITKLRIQHVESAVESKGSPLTIAVSPFDDKRQSSEHLGTRIRGGGGETYFDVMDGTLSQRVTKAFVDFLNQAGFSAVPANGAGSANVRIEPIIQKFKVEATDKALATHLEVDAIMAFAVHNAADESTVRIAIGVGGTDHEVFFSEKDLEKLIGEVLTEGFEEFLEKVEVQGEVLRFRLPEETS